MLKRGGINDLAKVVRASFSRVKEDITAQKEVLDVQQENIQRLIQWMNFVYENHKKLEDDQRTLTFHHDRHKALTRTDIKNLRDWISHFSKAMQMQKNREVAILNDLESLKNSIEGLDLSVKSLKSESSEHKKRLETVEEGVEKPKIIVKEPEPPKIIVTEPVRPDFEGQNRFESTVLKRIRPSRKEFIMQEIQKLAREGKHSTSDIEETIVNQKDYCGRTSFYAYLKELRLKGVIGYDQLAEKQVVVLND